MEKKILFFDVDGTLLSHITKEGVIYESTRLALNKLKENGHFISLATGRSYSFVKDLAEKFQIENVVYEGGNGVVFAGNHIHYEVMNQEALKRIIARFEELGLEWGVSNKNNHEVVTPYRKFYEEVSNQFSFIDWQYDQDYDYTSETSANRLFVENCSELLDEIGEIKEVGFMHYPGSPYALIEPDDKYKGIKKVLDILDGDEKDVIVFGDGLNDIKMFKQAACSVAMGNADEKLKAIATHITDDVDNDGIYNACVKLGLIEG